MTNELWLVIFFLVIMFVAHAPITYGLLGTLCVYLLYTGGDLGLVTSRTFNQIFQNFTFLAVPMFVFSANNF